jgi:hypothetical protein
MESATEPYQAQIAVGYVLMRRADFDNKNVCSEMKRPYQFSWYGYRQPPSSLQQKYFDLAYRVMHRIEVDYSYGAINFHDTTISKPKSWIHMTPIVQWSHLIFYKQGETKYASAN